MRKRRTTGTWLARFGYSSLWESFWWCCSWSSFAASLNQEKWFAKWKPQPLLSENTHHFGCVVRFRIWTMPVDLHGWTGCSKLVLSLFVRTQQRRLWGSFCFQEHRRHSNQSWRHSGGQIANFIEVCMWKNSTGYLPDLINSTDYVRNSYDRLVTLIDGHKNYYLARDSTNNFANRQSKAVEAQISDWALIRDGSLIGNESINRTVWGTIFDNVPI